MSIRIVILDDEGLYRRGLARVLELGGLEVVGQGPCANESVRIVQATEPDVVFVDCRPRPDVDRFALVARLKSLPRPPQVVVLSPQTIGWDVTFALVAGASAYLGKDASEDELVAAARSAAQGRFMLAPRAADEVVRVLRSLPPAWAAGSENGHAALSEREREVLRLMVGGSDNGDIARSLFISENTVKNHVAKILGKLGMKNRIQAAVYAVDAGIVPSPHRRR
jgi:DNA-binding NarL/FixJ family response regulator